MKARPLFFACAFAAMLLAAPGRVLAGNFSKSVTADETASAGLAQLSSDQLGALDALVRRDLALAANTPPAAPRPARFSARLSESERRSAGLTLLTAAKLEQLDTLVKRFASAPPPPLTSPSATVGDKTEANGPQTVSWRRKPEIHGMVSLMYGVGSHGYSERGGATVLTYDDPNRNFSVAVGYSQFRTTGDFLRYGYDRWGYGYDRWGYYDRGFDPLFPYR
jgi:hypothetical protein